MVIKFKQPSNNGIIINDFKNDKISIRKLFIPSACNK